MNRKYANDYEIDTQKDENGVEKQITVYRGDYYEVELNGEGIKKFRHYSLLLVGLMFLLHFGNGFLNVGGMYQFYIVFPYVIAFFPLLYMVSGAFKLPKEIRLFKRDEIELSFKQVENSSKIFLTLVGLLALGEVIFLSVFSMLLKVKQ